MGDVNEVAVINVLTRMLLDTDLNEIAKLHDLERRAFTAYYPALNNFAQPVMVRVKAYLDGTETARRTSKQARTNPQWALLTHEANLLQKAKALNYWSNKHGRRVTEQISDNLLNRKNAFGAYAMMNVTHLNPVLTNAHMLRNSPVGLEELPSYWSSQPDYHLFSIGMAEILRYVRQEPLRDWTPAAAALLAKVMCWFDAYMTFPTDGQIDA